MLNFVWLKPIEPSNDSVSHAETANRLRRSLFLDFVDFFLCSIILVLVCSFLSTAGNIWLFIVDIKLVGTAEIFNFY
jgi:hypothetical protein